MGSRLRLVAVGAALLAMWAPSLARADGGMERQFTDLVHRERAAAGLPAYAERADLVDVARGQAQRMAREKHLYHNPRLAEEVQNWQAVGENVGRGPSVASIHSAFMASTSHRQEILSRDFTEVGVGVAIADDGEIWVSQVFRAPLPAQQPEPPPPAPAPPPPAPGPAPAPAAPTAAAAVRTFTAAPTTATEPTTTTAPSTTQPPLPTTTTALDPLPPPAPPAPPEVLAATQSAPAPGPPVASQSGAGSALVGAEPEVSGPARIAAALLVLVVAAQVTYVWRAQLSSDEARRHRNHASMNSSRSPSSTPWTLPVS